MKKAKNLSFLYPAAGLLAVVAIWLTARTASGILRDVGQLARRRSDLIQLQGLAERQARQQSAFQTVAASGGTPVDLATWLREQQPALAFDISNRESVSLREGWSVRRVDARLADATLADISSLLTRLESLRPPWRLVEVTLTAGASPGRGRVALLLETLARGEDGSQP